LCCISEENAHGTSTTTGTVEAPVSSGNCFQMKCRFCFLRGSPFSNHNQTAAHEEGTYSCFHSSVRHAERPPWPRLGRQGADCRGVQRRLPWTVKHPPAAPRRPQRRARVSLASQARNHRIGWITEERQKKKKLGLSRNAPAFGTRSATTSSLPRRGACLGMRGVHGSSRPSRRCNEAPAQAGAAVATWRHRAHGSS